jgi:hypothetical protein
MGSGAVQARAVDARAVQEEKAPRGAPRYGRERSEGVRSSHVDVSTRANEQRLERGALRVNGLGERRHAVRGTPARVRAVALDELHQATSEGPGVPPFRLRAPSGSVVAAQVAARAEQARPSRLPQPQLEPRKCAARCVEERREPVNRWASRALTSAPAQTSTRLFAASQVKTVFPLKAAPSRWFGSAPSLGSTSTSSGPAAQRKKVQSRHWRGEGLKQELAEVGRVAKGDGGLQRVEHKLHFRTRQSTLGPFPS